MFLTMDMAKGLLGRTTGAVVAAGVLLVLAGCRDGDGGDGTKDAGAAVIAPGRPGEKARTLSPRRPPGGSPTTAPTRRTGRTCSTWSNTTGRPSP